MDDGAGRSIGNWRLPFGSVREAAEWWFGPVVTAPTWLAVGYLFVGALSMALFGALTITMLATALPLIVVGVGIPLTVLAFTAIHGLATVERHRARWVGAPIEPRPFRTAAGSWWQRLLDRLTDGERWRQVAFFLAGLVVVPTLLVVAVAGWSAVVSIVAQAVNERDVFALVLGLVLTGAAARLAVLAGRVGHAFVAWFLGPDRTAELEARVDTLSTQRQDILDAVAAERRRIERNLHDGVQQQLVALGIDIGRASAKIDTDPEAARRLLDDAREKVRGSVGELRLIGRGLHPAILDDRGLDAALSSVVAGAPIPIALDVDPAPLPIDLAETAYFVANEALANTLKHAHARVASVRLTRDRDRVVLVVHDDGRGGATVGTGGTGGTGLAGIAARVAALDGRLVVDSPVGGPTVITATFPLPAGSAVGGSAP